MAFNLTLRKTFLYVFASVGLVLMIVGGVSLIDLGLKTYVFKKAGNYCYYQIMPLAAPDKNGNVAQPTAEQQALQVKQCEDQRSADKQNQASNAIAMLIVGLPLYGYHWLVIRKENQV